MKNLINIPVELVRYRTTFQPAFIIWISISGWCKSGLASDTKADLPDCGVRALSYDELVSQSRKFLKFCIFIIIIGVFIQASAV